MLWNDFDKVIPKYDVLKKLLQTGLYGRLVEWTPLTITEDKSEFVVRW